MGSFIRGQIIGRKVDGHSLLETLIAITIISIVLTIATMSYNNVISSSVNFSETSERFEEENKTLNCIYNENCNELIELKLEQKNNAVLED